MKQKADRKKSIRRLTALSSRLQMLGVVLALISVVSAVRLPRTEIEPTEPTQIEITEETTIPATTVAAETSAATEQTSVATEQTSAAETTVAETMAAETMAETLATEAPAVALSNNTGKESGIFEDTANNDGGPAEVRDCVLSDEGQNHADSMTREKTNASDPGENGSENNKPGTKKAAIPKGLPWPPSTEHVLETEPTVPEKPEKPVNLWLILTIVSNGLLILDLIAIAVVQKKLKKLRKGPDVIPTTERIPWHAVPPEIGKVHGIGGRDYQQDSLGHTQILNGSGILAIVADGMGGLSNGEQVSQQIVMDGLGYGAAMTGLSEGNPLLGMVGQINTNVNRMLGPEGIYKCGSTLIAVLVAQDQFQWVSVGDSRIYLYREGYVNQLNTDHDLFQQWMPEILAGTRSYVEAARNPDGRKLTSFIGMGELKYVDYSRQPIDLRQGDRLVLVTDGVYGTVPPEQLADILKANPEVSDAAKVLERRIRDARMPHQDNYTALILGF